MLDPPWLKEKAAIFLVSWFLKLAGNLMPLWEEGIAVSVSETICIYPIRYIYQFLKYYIKV